MSVVIATHYAAKWLHVKVVDLWLVFGHEKSIKKSPSIKNAHCL